MTITAPAQASGVLEQWSSGPFQAQVSVAAGDVNGDGLDDLVSFNTFNLPNKVLLSTGSGFGAQQSWGGANTTFMGTGFRGNVNLVADMDNDGRADAVVVRFQPNPGIWVARSVANQFDSAIWWLNNNVANSGAMAADIDADGDQDVVGLFNYDVPALAARSNTTASLPLTAWGPHILGEKATLAADIDADGDADLVAVSPNEVWVLRSQ